MILSGHAEDREVVPDDASCDDEMELELENPSLSPFPLFSIRLRLSISNYLMQSWGSCKFLLIQIWGHWGGRQWREFDS